jgi:hypothetical protein
MSYPGSPSGEQQNDHAYSYPNPNTGGAYPPPSAEPAPAPDYGQQAYGGQPAPAPAPDYGQQAYAQPATQAFGQPAQPVSPAYGQPPAQPVSPAYGQPPAQPVSPAYGQPPAQPVSPAYGVNVPTQQVPVHDQSAAFNTGTAQIPAYGEPPTSGYGGYGAEPPMSGPPISPSPLMTGPIPFGSPQPPPQKRSLAVPILASLLALAVIAAGIFIGLYVDKSSKLSKSQTLASQRQSTIEATNAELDKTKKDLQTRTDELTRAQQDLRGTTADNNENKRQRDVIAKCLKLTYEALAATNKAAFDAKLAELKEPCDEANRLVGLV